MMHNMKGYPDFGYNMSSEHFRDMKGWRFFLDYLKKEPKFEKLTNLIKLKSSANFAR